METEHLQTYKSPGSCLNKELLYTHLPQMLAGLYDIKGILQNMFREILAVLGIKGFLPLGLICVEIFTLFMLSSFYVNNIRG